MPRSPWPTVAAALVLAACAEEPSALRGSEPNYTMVFFASGSTSLGKQARQEISKAVADPTPPVRAVLKPNSAAKICVTGHSDNTGAEPGNKEFGQRRAEAVAKYLVELGVPQRRIVTSSLGSARPLVVTPPNTPEVANRRVEIVFGC